MTTPAPSTAIRRQKLHGEASHGWSDLPDGPLHTILMRLCSLVDLISFKSVCRSWRAVASSLPPSAITSHFPPLLLIPEHFLRHLSLSCLPGFGVLDPTSPSFSSLLPLNSHKFKSLGRLCFSQGHLLGMLCNRVVIINLINGDEFYSPILPQDHRLYCPGQHIYVEPTTYVLTSSLSSPDLGLLVFTTGPLLYWRIGSASWSCYWPKTKISGELEVVTVQGKVYAMNALEYSLFVVDLSPKLHLRPLAVEGTKKDTFLPEHFLVDCGGELLQVQLVETYDLHMHIEVFQLDLSVNGPRWVKKETLGNWAIFVGYDFRLPGLAVENPERWGGKSNCVYFNRLKENRDSPFAVFKLGDEIDMLDQESRVNHEDSIFMLSSEWFHPSF